MEDISETLLPESHRLAVPRTTSRKETTDLGLPRREARSERHTKSNHDCARQYSYVSVSSEADDSSRQRFKPGRDRITKLRWESVTGSPSSKSAIALCVALVCTTLVINIVFAIVMVTKFDTQSGIGTFYSGSCQKVNNWSTVFHLLINVLSSMLLTSSNYVMQTLCAPTRQELDRAHTKGDWLDIGVLSARNLFGRISASRISFCVALALSSLPVHLLYNSAIFKSMTSRNYIYGVVHPDYAANTSALATVVQNANKEMNHLSDVTTFSTILAASALPFFYNSESKNSAVENLTNTDCITAYSTPFIDGRSDVLLISKCSSAFPESDMSFYDFSWRSEIGSYSALLGDDAIGKPFWMDRIGDSVEHIQPNNWTVDACKVDYCLSRVEETQCKLKFEVYILLAIIACNVIKAVVMTWALLRCQNDTVTTIGDAIASYITRPDASTAGKCLMAKRDVIKNRDSSMEPKEFPPVRGSLRLRPCWLSAVTTRRLSVTIGMSLAVISLATIGLWECTVSDPHSLSFSSFGRSNIQDVWWDSTQDSSFVSDVLVANSPQALVSIIYVSYNGLWTTMLLASEWDKYYLGPKRPLRVTRPRGQQRSTYWLQLPNLYSIPLLVAMITLHWMISESIFSAQVEAQSGNSLENLGQLSTPYVDALPPASSTNSVIAYSCLPILLSIILGSLMIMVMVATGILRKLRNPMPLASSCSLAVAAACHPPKDDLNAAYLSLSWGAIDDAEYYEDNGVGHCSFTTKSVHSPVPGQKYA